MEITWTPELIKQINMMSNDNRIDVGVKVYRHDVNPNNDVPTK